MRTLLLITALLVGCAGRPAPYCAKGSGEDNDGTVPLARCPEGMRPACKVREEVWSSCAESGTCGELGPDWPYCDNGMVMSDVCFTKDLTCVREGYWD